MPLTTGARLGPYEIVSALGAGGMGEVYIARDSKLNRDVAIKILPDALAADPVALNRFQTEAQAVPAWPPTTPSLRGATMSDRSSFRRERQCPVEWSESISPRGAARP